jgi:translation elongation factor EF-Ts
MGQAFVKDNSKSIADYLTGVGKDLKVVSFHRVQLG